MAHKKGVGSSKNGRDSESKRLGVKKYANEKVVAGNIKCSYYCICKFFPTFFLMRTGAARAHSKCGI